MPAAKLRDAEVRGIPQAYALDANYPNPFNPSTTIGYQLPMAAQVRLEIYDLMGQRVKTLVQDVEPAGYHRMMWDSLDDAGRPVAAGVYFYRLQAGEFTQARKLLLLK